MFLFGPVRVEGRERVPKSGPLLVLSNHISDCDPPVVAYAIQRPVYFMAKEELFRIRFFGGLIRWLRAFPVKRGAPDRAALRMTMHYLEQGEAVVIFPEGQLSESGHLQPIQPGAAMIARMTGAPVMCVGLRGTNRIMPFRSLIPRPAFGGVRVRIGEPKSFTKEASTEEILKWIQGELFRLTQE